MKAAVVVKMKGGYLIVERDIESLTTEEIFSGSVVDIKSYSYKDRVGEKVVTGLGLFTKEEEEND